jgi:hypothetical protein
MNADYEPLGHGYKRYDSNETPISQLSNVVRPVAPVNAFRPGNPPAHASDRLNYGNLNWPLAGRLVGERSDTTFDICAELIGRRELKRSAQRAQRGRSIAVADMNVGKVDVSFDVRWIETDRMTQMR